MLFCQEIEHKRTFIPLFAVLISRDFREFQAEDKGDAIFLDLVHHVICAGNIRTPLDDAFQYEL